MTAEAAEDLCYWAEPTISEFHLSDAFYRILIGPVGSGKSTGCCMELMRRAREQRPGRNGVRHTRFAVIRNTYRELEDTTLKTWNDWFSEDSFGPVNRHKMTHTLRFEDVEMEVLFRALDRPGDIKKVLSMELTGAWINEVREVPKGIVDAIGDRTGRYPAVKDGGCTWDGVIADTNPPDEDHWIYRLAEEERPEGWQFFRQPGGVTEVEDEKFIPNPDAENLQNLPPDYYVKRVSGKAPGYIRVYYAGQYGFVQEGKPVHPEYVDSIHCAKEILNPIPGRLIYVGMDFGLTPAALFGQRLVTGRWQIIDELVTEDMGTVRFAELLKTHINHEYPDYEFEFWGDPAGDDRSQTDERTPFKILNTAGIPAKACLVKDNDTTIRREALKVTLGRLIDGKPGLILSPKCKITRKGLAGGFAYRRMQVAGDERYHDKPDKNRYSHPCEALEYLLLGAGEGKELVQTRGQKQARAIVTMPLPTGPNAWMGA